MLTCFPAKNDWIVDVVVAAGTVSVSLQDRRGHSNATVFQMLENLKTDYG